MENIEEKILTVATPRRPKDKPSDMIHHITDGEYSATVFLNKFLIDKGTMAQIHKMMFHPATNHMRIMPDCHRGSGCCVGYTSYLTTKIVPKFIGGDIGCGMITYKINKKLIKSNLKTEKNLSKIQINELSLEEIDFAVRKLIPMGTGKGSIFTEKMLKQNTEYLNSLWDDIRNEAHEFSQQYHHKYDVNLTEYIPDYSYDWFLKKCQQIGAEPTYDLLSLGTLGGGNHFIEFNYSDEDDELYITIHSGSRNIGQKICQYHQDKINESKYFDKDTYIDKEKKTSRHFKGKPLHVIMEDIKMKLLGERHPDYLEKEEAYNYYFDMIFAQHFAHLNRKIMLYNILDVIKIKDKIQKIYDDDPNLIISIHNYIDFTDFIVRKGAIKASKDKLCVIALNMRDGILICKGKGNSDWNFSAAHGAGRVINRQQAYNKLKLKKFKEEMDGIYSSSVVIETLDESPMVYRDVEIIKKALANTVTIEKQIKPIINMKGLD